MIIRKHCAILINVNNLFVLLVYCIHCCLCRSTSAASVVLSSPNKVKIQNVNKSDSFDIVNDHNLLSRLLIDKGFQGTSRVEFMFGSNKNYILGNYTNFGKEKEVNGPLVKLHPMRACQRQTLGLDATLVGHIVVVMMDGIIEPFLAGCISPYNQARFAQDSMAMGVLFDAHGMRSTAKQRLLDDPPLDIPVVTIGGLQAQSMRAILQKAYKDGHAMDVAIKRNILDTPKPTEPADQLKWKEIIPAVSDVGIFFALLVLVIFVFVLILVKINLKPKRTRDVSLQSLTRCALAKMEIKKYRSNKKKSLKHKRNGFTPPTAASISLLGSKQSLNGSAISETCAICLEDFKDGQILRVILCGHEFHKKCVDPWLLQNRTCPLCLFDVVFEKYVSSTNRSAEDCPSTVIDMNPLSPPNANPNMNMNMVLMSATNLGSINVENSNRVTNMDNSSTVAAATIRRQSVSEQFWQFGFWEGFGEKRTLDWVYERQRSSKYNFQQCNCTINENDCDSQVPVNLSQIDAGISNFNNDPLFASTRSVCCASCVNKANKKINNLNLPNINVKKRKRKFQQNNYYNVKRMPKRYTTANNYANSDSSAVVQTHPRRCRRKQRTCSSNLLQKRSVATNNNNGNSNLNENNMQISEGYLSDISSALTIANENCKIADIPITDDSVEEFTNRPESSLLSYCRSVIL